MRKLVKLTMDDHHETLINEGFRMQKLFADDIPYYIFDVRGGVIDDSLFIRAYDLLLRNFMQLDYGRLRMMQDYATSEKEGVFPVGYEWLKDVNIEQLRKDLNPLVLLVESIQAGNFDADLSRSLNQEPAYKTVFLGFDVKTGRVMPLPESRDDNALSYQQNIAQRAKHYYSFPREIIFYHIHQAHFDWIFKHAKSGDLIVVAE